MMCRMLYTFLKLLLDMELVLTACSQLLKGPLTLGGGDSESPSKHDWV